MKKNILTAALLCLAVVTSGQAVAAPAIEPDVCVALTRGAIGLTADDSKYTCLSHSIRTLKSIYDDGFRIVAVAQSETESSTYTSTTLFLERPIGGQGK